MTYHPCPEILISQPDLFPLWWAERKAIDHHREKGSCRSMFRKRVKPLERDRSAVHHRAMEIVFDETERFV
jgi:hypothetical protein